MSIVEEYYTEGKNSSVMHLRTGEDELIEITAWRGVFGDIAIAYKKLEEVDNGKNKENDKIHNTKE